MPALIARRKVRIDRVYALQSAAAFCRRFDTRAPAESLSPSACAAASRAHPYIDKTLQLRLFFTKSIKFLVLKTRIASMAEDAVASMMRTPGQEVRGTQLDSQGRGREYSIGTIWMVGVCI